MVSGFSAGSAERSVVALLLVCELPGAILESEMELAVVALLRMQNRLQVAKGIVNWDAADVLIGRGFDAQSGQRQDVLGDLRCASWLGMW
jgi:hypothetical protein